MHCSYTRGVIATVYFGTIVVSSFMSLSMQVVQNLNRLVIFASHALPSATNKCIQVLRLSCSPGSDRSLWDVPGSLHKKMRILLWTMFRNSLFITNSDVWCRFLLFHGKSRRHRVWSLSWFWLTSASQAFIKWGFIMNADVWKGS